MKFINRSLIAALAIACGRAALAQDAPTTVPTLEPSDQPILRLGRDGKPLKEFLKLHQRFLDRGKADPIGVLFFGDSITMHWDQSPDLFQQFYGQYQPANFGIRGDGTQHMLWRIANGELDNVKPKVVVLMAGTNNYKDSARNIAGGVKAIVAQIRAKLPESKILLLAILPRGDDPADPVVAKLRDKYKRANAFIAKLDDGKTVRYFDFGDKLLMPDGKLNAEAMPDDTHPSHTGYGIWGNAMQPLLDEMMR
jgi:lysophospholipase L1-like esterase